MTKYDLHCHSTASDGVLSPTEVVLRAYEKGVNVLALTDHDTVAGVPEARKQADSLGIRLINGVELSTFWENRSIHIVGLGFDISNEKMTALLAEQARLRDIRAQEIGAKLAKAGVINAYWEAKKLAGDGEVTRAHYARHLVQIGKVSNDTMTTKWVRKLVESFKAWGGDAMEISGCGQSRDQFQLLVKIAEDNQLAGSVGSDFHFPSTWLELGKLAPLPPNIPFVLDLKNNLA